MIPASVQHDNSFLKKLTRAPRGIEKKAVPKDKLEQYFDVISLEDLVYTLHQFSQHGYFKHEVILSSEYLDWEEARINALVDTSPLKDVDPFGVSRQKKYRLAILDREIKTDTPLRSGEVSEVIRVLDDNGMAERYLRFRLSGIDQKRLREIVAARPSASRRGTKIDNYYVVGHKGLIVGISDVTYKGKLIHLTKQQRELLRVFVARPGAKLTYDVFYDNPEIFRRGKTHKNPHETVSKLISKTHTILEQNVGECIFNKPKEGWCLKIG
jgi:hypothetical protein